MQKETLGKAEWMILLKYSTELNITRKLPDALLHLIKFHFSSENISISNNGMIKQKR